ncbi:MAG: polysaccharide deacetylase family protein [Candidatus Omnitrophota bacterium]
MKKARIIIVSSALLLGSVTFVFMNTAYVPPVLMYHSVDYNDKATKLSVRPESLETHMKYFRDNRYNVVTLDKMIDYIRNKEKVPPKTVAITFDDGYYNNYKHAYPILKKYGIPATIFVIVNKIGTEGYLGWKEIREMSDSGIVTIGSHTISHKWLPSLGTKELKNELTSSKAILEEKLGKPVTAVCYPMGAHNSRVEREASLAGYSYAVATNTGRLSPSDDLYAIKRIKISRTSDNPIVLWFETSGYYTWVKEHKNDRANTYN